MIKVIKSGLYTSFQDQGRFGFRNLGIPVSGAMDITSAKLANSILKNAATEAVLEFTLLGPTLRFECDAVICITGASFKPLIHGVPVTMFEPISVKKGSKLQMGVTDKGIRGYLAVCGGFDCSNVLNSYSQYNGVTTSFRLVKGEELRLNGVKSTSISNVNLHKNLFSNHAMDFSELNLRVTKGPEFDTLSSEEQKMLMQFKGIIDPQSNRMAYLLGAIPTINPSQIITSAVQPGTIQMTPSGQVIVLMRDAQTTGGYARVLQLTPKAIDILSQKRPLENVRFKWK